MKSTKLFLIVALTAAAAIAAEPTQVQNDNFSMTLPTGFGQFAQQSTTANKIETTTWISKSPTGEAVVVSMSKMPGKIVDADKLFSSTRDALLKSTNATLDNETKVNPTTDTLSFHSNNGAAFLRSRLIVAGDRLYNVLYVGHSEDQRNNPAVGTMFEGFMIPGAPVAQTSASTSTAH